MERPKPCHLTLDVEIEGAPEQTKPGTLEFFLVERYQLFASIRGQLLSGRVFHRPYEIQPAQVKSYESLQLTVLGLPDRAKWDSILFSPGVDVEVFALAER